MPVANGSSMEESASDGAAEPAPSEQSHAHAFSMDAMPEATHAPDVPRSDMNGSAESYAADSVSGTWGSSSAVQYVEPPVYSNGMNGSSEHDMASAQDASSGLAPDMPPAHALGKAAKTLQSKASTGCAAGWLVLPPAYDA